MISKNQYCFSQPAVIENSAREYYYECLHGQLECQRDVEQGCLFEIVESERLEMALFPCALDSANLHWVWQS